MESSNENAIGKASELIRTEMSKVRSDPSVIKVDGCVACSMLSALASITEIGEVAAGDLLTEVLSQDEKLNEEFVSVVEYVHRKQRFLGTAFVAKTREGKDRFIEGNFKNGIEELLNDSSVFGTSMVFRKLIMEHVALQLAQNIGVDYHAASEELYYYMRKNDKQTNAAIIGLIDSIYQKLVRGKHD